MRISDWSSDVCSSDLEAQPDQDRELLERLALHAVGRWTPAASVSGSDGLWLDLTGTTHLFGCEERFCRRLLRFLDRLGLPATIPLASTPGAAPALAPSGGARVAILQPGAQTEAIADSPSPALRLPPEPPVASARLVRARLAALSPCP